MFCGECNNDLGACICLDIEARLKNLRSSRHVATKWCTKCDQHHTRCRCEQPAWASNFPDLLKQQENGTLRTLADVIRNEEMS